MFVHLILGGHCKRISRIFTDLEKCVPCVGTYVEWSVDPALWYKVLAIDSILVDCDRKLVWWTCNHRDVRRAYICSPEQEHGPAILRHCFEDTEQLFRENVELSPSLTELFNAAEDVFDSLSPEVIDKVGNVSMYKNLIKIIHVYILPEIRFVQKHIKSLQRVLDTVEKEYENVEMLIKMSVQLKKNCEENLSRQRKYLLSEEGVENILNNPSRDDDGIKLLIRHSAKDIRKLEDIQSVLTDKITPLRNATDEVSVNSLKETRAKRDKVAREKDEIIKAKEELVNDILLRRKPPTRKQKRDFTLRKSQSLRIEHISDTLHRYQRETNDLDSLGNDIKKQINTKIRMSSIREAVCLTIKEIGTDGSSFGYNRKKGSLEIEADLFDPNRKPKEWITLKEQIRTYLQTNHSDLGTKHEQFCTMVKENCKAVTEKAKRDFLVNYGVLGSGRLAFSLGSSLPDQDKTMRFSTRWLFGSVPKEDCEALCKQISDHISDMADEIAVEIQENSTILTSFHTQVYICYEEHVSNELMPVLSKLYEQSFTQQCKELSTWINDYSATELDVFNKTLKSLFPNLQENENGSVKIQNRQSHIKRSASFVDTVFGTSFETSGSVSQTVGRTWNFLKHRNRVVFSDPNPQSEQDKLNTLLKSTFGVFFTIIEEEDNAVSIFSKLRHMTRAVQSAQQTFSDLLADLGKHTDLCTDDILDILVLLICRLDPRNLLKLYAHANLILHLSPYFLEGNINEYSLISLTGAYQHLFERQEMHESFSRQHSSGHQELKTMIVEEK